VTRPRLLLAVALLLLVAATAAAALLLTGGGKEKAKSPPRTNVVTDNAAGYGKPFRPGDPHATEFGAAFQVLDSTHGLDKAQDAYWLGPRYHGAYPYVRAMLGGGAEVQLAVVSYASYRSADVAHLLIETFDTRTKKPQPLKPGEMTSGPRAAVIQTEGSLLARQAKSLPQHKSPLGPYVLTPQGGALVFVAPHLIVKLTALDATLGPLPQVIKALQPYPAG
jgi:hypothetical protein